MRRIYYYLKLTQTSPLRLSCGGGEETDSDLKTDGRGLPFIPGSSLAGVLRSGFTEDKARILFGDIDIAFSIEKKENVAIPSRLIISSAELSPDTDRQAIKIMSRDGVGLDDWGLTIDKAKYDFQVVETKQPYFAVIEWTGNEEEEKKELKELLEPYLAGIITRGLSFGSRTSRGYGAMNVEVRKREFSFPEQLSDWLDYHAISERFAFLGNEIEVKPTEKPEDKPSLIEITFQMLDSFNIRVRTARQEALPDGTIPDSVPLMNAEENPVIPGTAWAGVFRHHMHRLLRESGVSKDVLDGEIKRMDYECFGMSHEKGKDHVRSNIRFSETEVEGGRANTIVRNAVDRYTAAPKNTGLFTSQVWTGGLGKVQIQVGPKVKEQDRRLLELSIMDMGIGLLTVGGEAGIGRGMIHIEKVRVDGMDRTSEFVLG